MRLGMLGFNEGNGHPFSFSAIVNGFDEEAMRDAGWGVIADYLVPRRDEIGLPGVVVTHVWAPDPAIAEQIRRAARVAHRVDEPTDLLSRVDAVVIARDDWQHHERLAGPFLAAGIPTFVDKPLTLSEAELARFVPHLESGRLASWSGLRFAPELDPFTEQPEPPQHIHGSGPLGWDTYAIHLLEPALRLARRQPLAVLPNDRGEASVTIELEGDGCIEIDVLGDTPAPFALDCTSDGTTRRIEMTDRFTAFKRALEHFVSMVRSQRPSVPPEETLTVLRTLIAGRRALDSGERTPLAKVA